MLTVKGNLANRFFTDEINVYRRSYTINKYGESVYTETDFPVNASVQPTSGRELSFLPDFALESETLSFFTLEMLYSESDDGTGYSDIVVFDNHRYQIIKSKRWKTHCESIGILEAYSE